MKKIKLFRLLSVGFLAGMGLGLITGCEKDEKVDYSINGITEDGQAQSDGKKSGMKQFQDTEKWKEKWKTSDVMADVTIDARIVIPDAEYMSVIEVREPEFDAEYKEKMVKKLFESGDIYYGDTGHMTKKEVDELKAFEDDGGVLFATRASGRMAWGVPSADEKWEEWVEEWNAAMENPMDNYTLADEYTENQYIGTYEGKSYKLDFVEDSYSVISRIKEIRFEPKDLKDVCPEEFQTIRWPACTLWTKGDVLENHARISEEEALKQAQRFVEKMGMDYPVFAYSSPLIWGDATGVMTEEAMANWPANGYVFTFDFGADDISFVEYGIERDYFNYGVYGGSGDKKEREQGYSMEARTQVYVTDMGVIRMSAYNPLETVSVSERVEMLSLDTVKKIIKEQLDTHYNDLGFFPKTLNNRFDRMDLIYFRLEDKENPGNYSYIPVWRLSSFTEDEVAHSVSVHDPIMVNAIDGSMIDMWWDWN